MCFFTCITLIQNVFDELNSETFLEWLNFITEIEEPLIADPTLSGGGLHQSMNGAFLNVHVDFNIHPKTKYLLIDNKLYYDKSTNKTLNLVKNNFHRTNLIIHYFAFFNKS